MDRYLLSRMNDLFSDEPTVMVASSPCTQVSTAPNRRRSGLLGAKMDLIEKPTSFLYNIDLPGVRKEDIQLHVENGQLSILAERKEERKDETDRYHFSERTFGSIKRVVSLPERADANKCKADFADGVLKLEFEKRPEEANRKKIAIA